ASYSDTRCQSSRSPPRSEENGETSILNSNAPPTSPRLYEKYSVMNRKPATATSVGDASHVPAAGSGAHARITGTGLTPGTPITYFLLRFATPVQSLVYPRVTLNPES